VKPKRVYGALTTRSTIEFRPSRLLCKRFNIANPFPPSKGTDGDADGQEKEILNEKTMEELKQLVDTREGDGVSRKKKEDEVDGEKEKEDTKDDVVGVIEGIPEPENRPALDIFKAIFDASDDEDEGVSEKKVKFR
jgi:G patch domain-containing protein 1